MYSRTSALFDSATVPEIGRIDRCIQHSFVSLRDNSDAARRE